MSKKKKKWNPPSNCEELVKWCRIFLQEEPRDVVYKYAVRLARSDDRDEKLDGILLLLTSWNAAYYKYNPISLDELISKIGDLLDKTSGELNELHDKKLEDLNPDDFKKVESLFYRFWKNDAVGCTGASKLLHILEPQLFVMWDNDIKKNYHRDFPNYRHKWNHRCGNEKCYTMFLKQMRECSRNLIKEKSKGEICKECSNKLFEVDLPKAIDQYNYANAKFS